MDWKYIAGFFDGEGSITLYKTNRNRWGRAVKVNIEQKNIKVLKEIKAFLLSQGLNRIGVYTRKTRTISCLQIQNKFDIDKFIDGVFPYVIVKKPICIKAKKFLADKWFKIGHYSELDKKNAVKLYHKHKNYAEVSRLTGATRKSIRNWVKSS